MQEFEKLHMAFRIGGELTGILEECEIGKRLLEELFQILPADRGCFYLTEGKSPNLQQVYAVDVGGAAGPDLKLETTRSMVRSAAARRVGVLVQDLPQDPRFREQEKGNLARSAMTVPLVRRGQVMGVIQLENVKRPQAFSSDDLDLVVGVGVHVAAAVENLRLYQDVEGERKARERVSRYLSPSLVEQVVKGKKDINLGGEKADITVLFADLRGFTSNAESMPPDEVVVMLNEFFELAVDLIFKFGGTLDKFIGDAVMAFWGVPTRRVIDPHLTVMTALKMQAEIHCLNERRRKLGKKGLGLGVGIHTGLAVAGNIGTPQRMDYTIIGDTVNLASRIQDLAPGGQVLISRATRDRMGNLLVVTDLQETKVKGRSESVELFRVHGMYLQEQVAHELRKVRRMQTCVRICMEGLEEDEHVPGVLVDLSPVGTGVIFEEAARYRFDIGGELRLEILEEEGPFSGKIVGQVAAVREVFERAGTVYLHVGLKFIPGGIPNSLREFFFRKG
jgi:adenylate cyclase